MSINDFVNNNNSAQESKNNLSSKLPKFSRPNLNFNFKNPLNRPVGANKKHLYIGGALIALALVFLVGRALTPDATLGEITGGDPRREAPSPVATQGLNKTFEFPLMDENNREVAKIRYQVESANLQDAFIYQGKMATAVKGRTFLIFNVKITNPYTQTIEVNTKDYIRVKINGSSEQLAPEIHNDPVQIQAKSTKYARIGLPINDTDKNIEVLIGELNGEKETVKLNLTR